VKLERSFVIEAPLDDVWRALIDIERVAPCLPGAEITESNDDGTYRGNFTVKLGPTTASYRGKLEMVAIDEEGRRATLQASGQDKRGQGSAKMTMVSTLHEADRGTRVEVETDFTITGRLARFGRGGMIEDVSDRLLGDFSSCLQERISSPGGSQPPAESRPIGGVSLFFSVLWQRVKRLLGGRASRS
jgi:carbon monoxide dehydrogenase subunit G